MAIQAAISKAATPASRYIDAETVLGVIINIFMAGLVTTLTNRAEAFNGADLAYVASDMVKATVIPILAFGIGLTLVTRKRLGTGAVTALVGPSPAWAPQNVILRMALLALIALFMLGAPATLALQALGAARSLTPFSLMGFKLAYGALIGLVMTPIVLVLALYDRPVVPRAVTG